MTQRLPDDFIATPIAHRGLHNRSAGVIENSRAAAEAAAAAGYALELDLQISADGEAMVFHDYTLDRLTAAEGPVSARSARELSETMLDGGGEGVPTLPEILDIVRGRVPIIVEVKDQGLAGAPIDGRLERRAAQLLSGYRGLTALMAFNPHSVAVFRDVAPQIPRGRVTCGDFTKHLLHATNDRAAKLAEIDDLSDLGASFISHGHEALGDPAPVRVRAGGLPVFCWTIRSAEQAEKAAPFSDNITFEGFHP